MGYTGRQVALARRPAGAPVSQDFRIEQYDMPPLQNGQLLLSVKYLSLDPYMRGRMDDRKSYSAPTPIGGVMEGDTVAEVIDSRHPAFKVGELVLSRLGWRTHAISDGTGLTRLDERFNPVTTALGVLGMPGLTAYAGLLEIGKPKPGDTVVVAAASGPVGSLVGQIAMIKGARVVGIAGGETKCAYVKDVLGFDAVVDHRSPTFAQDLGDACPRGIDVYFELVGGAVWKAVLPLLNTFSRVPVCGLVAQYNGNAPSDGEDQLPVTMREVLSRSLLMRGFIVREFESQRAQFLNDVSGWLEEGKVKFREDTIFGLENAPEALIGLLEGRNFGKVIVQVDGY